MVKNIFKRKNGEKFVEGNLLLIVVILMVFLSIATKNFLTATNLKNLVRQTSVNGIIALGMTFVIITSGIDLAVGSIVGLASILSAKFMTAGMPIPFAILICLVFCTLVGVVDGVVIQYGKVPAFIATLGMMQALRGVVMLISGARMIAGLPKSFTQFARAEILGLPSLFFIWLLVIILTWVITSKTVYGRGIYAYGSNLEAARLSGVSIPTVTISVYAISGLLSGLAGILMTSRLGNGIPTAGQSYEMDAIAATVVGGASLNGGAGTILGTVLGALLISTIQNGGNLLGLNSFILQIIVGVLIVVSVWLDQQRKSQKK